MKKSVIEKVTAREILDSRGNPTVEATVTLVCGVCARASVPSGASTGIYEAHERRDGGARYGGRGVLAAVEAVNGEISAALAGHAASNLGEIDGEMRKLDGTSDLSRLGANAVLAVSVAASRAAGASLGMPFWRYIGGTRAMRLPVPMFNILNGGAHASNNVEVQEFMVVPKGAGSFAEALRQGSEIYHALGAVISARGLSSAVGDEGGYAPNFDSDEEALDVICEAIDAAGYGSCGVRIALDAAASEWFVPGEGVYRRGKRGDVYTADELIEYWCGLCEKYPVCSIEDGLDQRDFAAWQRLTDRLGNDIMTVGDDLFVTNPSRLKTGIELGAANAVLVKPNQIGTLSDTVAVCEMAAASNYSYIVSHRSGETADDALADIAVGLGAQYIKAGAPCRGERTAKYNRLTEIESEIGEWARYGSARVKKCPRGATLA